MKVIRDTWLVLARQIQLALRQPVWLVIGLMMPVLYLVLFGPLQEKALQTTREKAYQQFTPGMLVMMAIFGTLFVGFGLIAELRAGVIERMRVTPVSRIALLFGRAGRDVAMLLVQSIILVALAVPFGLKIEVGPVLLMFALLALIGLLCSSLSYGLALLTRSEDALAPIVQTFSQPLLLTAGILLPMALAPKWLQNVSDFNPFSWAVTASRALFVGRPEDPSVWKALVILVVLAALSVFWGARSFAKAVR